MQYASGISHFFSSEDLEKFILEDLKFVHIFIFGKTINTDTISDFGVYHGIIDSLAIFQEQVISDIVEYTEKGF